MIYLLYLLTAVLIVDCLILVFLVLLQLPKKEAGAGLAFGGATTDALFGAGSGTVLTKITKYSATTFFVLCLVISTLQSRLHGKNASEFEKRLKESPAAVPGAATAPPAAPATVPATAAPTATGSNEIKLPVPAEDANVPAKPAATPPAPVATPPPATKP